MTTHVHVLEGCRPRPLASYLKALGVLRLVAQQADPQARGLWKHDQFVLATRLDTAELLQFFLHGYAPTPLVAPWNGASGFYPKDNKRGIGAIEASSAPRLANYRAALALGRELTAGLSEAPKNAPKFAMQRRMRQRAEGALAEWLDAVVVLGSDGEPSYPALLGTGGNDGHFDFTNNFMQRLGSLLDCSSADAPGRAHAEASLRRALWDEPLPGDDSATMGQFDPGSVSGVNFGNGFDGKSVTDPWDFVLLLEGSVALGSAATRRLAAQSPSQAAAPFAVMPAAGGYASASGADEGARGEQWFPLWRGPARFSEVRSLFAEGRATLGRHTARGALDFARSVARLGVARGIDAFERYGYIERNGQANLATPLGRWPVQARPHVQLLDEVDGWFQQLRRAAGAKGAPASLARNVRAIQSAMLRCCQHGRTRDWQQLWFCLGAAEQQLVRSPKFTAERGLQPLPPLDASWLAAVDDGGDLCRLAASLALLRDPEHRWGLRRHFLPLDNALRPRFSTSAVGLALGPEQVAAGHDAAVDLARLLRRRVQIAQRVGGGSLGLSHLGPGASLQALCAWTEGQLDSSSLSAWLPAMLALGRGEASRLREHFANAPRRAFVVDPVFALLRLALPHQVDPSDPDRVRLDPALVAALQAERIEQAGAVALRRLRSVGILPLLQRVTAPASCARRLLSGLLFPLDRGDLGALRHTVTRPPSSASQPESSTSTDDTATEGNHDNRS